MKMPSVLQNLLTNKIVLNVVCVLSALNIIDKKSSSNNNNNKYISNDLFKNTPQRHVDVTLMNDRKMNLTHYRGSYPNIDTKNYIKTNKYVNNLEFQ